MSIDSLISCVRVRGQNHSSNTACTMGFSRVIWAGLGVLDACAPRSHAKSEYAFGFIDSVRNTVAVAAARRSVAQARYSHSNIILPMFITPPSRPIFSITSSMLNTLFILKPMRAPVALLGYSS